MNERVPVSAETGKPRGSALLSIAKVATSAVVMGALLFLAAGRLDWPGAWAYVILITTGTIVSTLLLPKDLQAERSTMQQGSKRWDIALALIVARFGPLAVLLTAGLDRRFGWSGNLAAGLQALGLLLTALGVVFTTWAMLSNRFFSALVRIQTDRGHTVVSTGPYALVRHPGYLGASVAQLAMPLALSSWWAMLPALVTLAVLVVRTTLEDRTLQAELPGYREYAQRVRYRLLPGVW
ncbi:MAG: methyltransferase family protein [Anaerolineae bacterium]